MLKSFLEASEYIDFCAPDIQRKANALCSVHEDAVERVKATYQFVRDAIPHSFDCDAKIITARASDVLKHQNTMESLPDVEE